MLALKLSLFAAWVAVKATFCACRSGSDAHIFQKNKSSYHITKVSSLPVEANESSGLALAQTDKTFYTHNDSGGSSEVYSVNMDGRLEKTIAIAARNQDWEDLAMDPKGNLYIGDFGNNLNKRKDLKIYRVNPENPAKIDTIHFSYPDQQAFPPPAKELNFDCEAFFYYQDSLYLFSKNRGNAAVKMYTIPAEPGTWVGKLATTQQLKGQVTAADISPDHSRFALLAYGKIYIFEVKEGTINFEHPSMCIPFGRGGQSEGLVFLNNHDLLITNEKGKVFLFEYKGH